MIPHSTSVLLGLIAGGTIYIGLLAARWRRLPEAARPALALISAGILLFLAIEVGYHSFESVETAFRLGHTGNGMASLLLVALGLALGLVALGIWEDRRPSPPNTLSQEQERGSNVSSRSASSPSPVLGGRGWGLGASSGFDLALMTAVGIGVHNFGEGLAIGQSYASGASALGAMLVAGFALHNATEGFGIVGAMRGERASWGRILLLGAIGGGPTVIGTVIGGFWTSALLVTFCYALAAGSLLYVVRELLRIPFKLPARAALTAVSVGILVGLVTEAAVETAQAGPRALTSAITVELRIAGGKFEPAALEMPSGAALRIRNEDGGEYVLEGPQILRGDVPVEARGSHTEPITVEPGQYTIFAEDHPQMQLAVRVTGAAAAASGDPKIVETALKSGRQPVYFGEPQYGAYTSFNLTGKGEAARQEVLQALHMLSEQISGETLPAELAQYFTRGSWAKLRPSVAMVVGLGPGMYDGARFGPRVAASKPAGLHRIYFDKELAFDQHKTQRDLIVRVTSDSLWFNQQVCREAWRRLRGKITDETLDFGYANPNGRSPILGGFFDGTGNPIGKERDTTVFGPGGANRDTFLAWFKIRFDQERFMAHSLAEQEALIGRYKGQGTLKQGSPEAAHQVRAEAGGKATILRQAFVFDYGPKETGLLFASVQADFTKQLEGVLCVSMMQAGKPNGSKDRLLNYMHFEEGGYYYVPPAPANGYPGML